MAKREKLETTLNVPDLRGKVKNNYFTAPKAHHQFVSTGCTTLDCALGGGFALGRVANLVGDKSTSKTGLSTECLINFCRSYPDGQAAYRDIEAAFDEPYAEAMGLPIAKVDFGQPFFTVEDFHRDLEKFVDKQLKTGNPGIYILDSFDALSDEAEMARDIGDATFGGSKAKKSGELFRRLTAKIESSKVLLLIVSQVRDNIGAMFGEKHRRSGGKALDFYASQIVWLAHIGMLKRTINKVERAYGIEVRAKVKKNKIGMPFRETDFTFVFGFGVDDAITSINWLADVGRLDAIGVNASEKKEYLKELDGFNDVEYKNECVMIAEAVKKVWADVESTFLPKRTKYSDEL